MVENAQEEWKKVKGDKEAVEKFHTLRIVDHEFKYTPLLWHDVKTYKKMHGGTNSFGKTTTYH